MEYGSIQRQQSSDKNKGFTGTKVVEQGVRENRANTREARTELVRQLHATVNMIPPEKQLDIPQFGDVGNRMLNKGAEDLARSISGIAEIARDGWRKETTDKLALKASAEQGTAIAINTIIEAKKRNPFMASVLGQTVTSRVAEAQSIQNATTALYNDANENMPKLAELNTEDAMEVLASKGEDLVSAIKDPEMRQVAMNSLLAKMPKLAQAHHKERYALMRNLQIANNRESIVNKRVAFEHDIKGAVLPEEVMGARVNFVADLYKVNDPTRAQRSKADVKEYRALVHTQAATDLRNGNKTLYDAIRSIPKGEKNALTDLERSGFKAAEAVYDKHQNTMAGQVIAEAKLGILAAETPEESDAAMQISRQELAKWSIQGTQSEIDIKNQKERKAQLEGILTRDSAAWAKNQVDKERRTELDNVHNMLPIQRAAVMQGATKKEKQYVSNLLIPQLLSKITGQPLDQAKEAGLNVFTTGIHYKDKKNRDRFMSPVTFAQLFVRYLADTGEPVPDVIQNFVDTQMRSMTVGKGEKGKSYSQEQRTSFRVMEALVEGASGINMSQDDRVHLEFMRRGFNSGESPESVEAEFKEYKNNKGLKDPSLEKRLDRQMDLKSTIKGLIHKDVSDRVFTEYQSMYSHIEQSVRYDQKIAKAVFAKEVLHSSSVVQGLKVSNGRKLDEALGGDYGLDALLSNMGKVKKYSKVGEVISAGSPMLMAMFGSERDNDQKMLTDTSRLQLSNIEYIPGDDSVEFKVIGGGVTRIPLDYLRNVGKIMKADKLRNNFIKATDKIMTFQGRTIQGSQGTLNRNNQLAVGSLAGDAMMEISRQNNRKKEKGDYGSYIINKILSLFD